MTNVKFVAAVLLLCASALPAVAAEPFHANGEWRQYNRDWLAACPDKVNEDAAGYYGTSCFASTGSAEKNSASLPAYSMTIVVNRLTGVTDLALTVAADDVSVDFGRPLVVAFGGEAPISFDMNKDMETRDNVSNQFFVADPARSAALLDKLRLRNAAKLTVPITGMTPNKQVTLSLRGVAASLDFMDVYARKLAQY